MQENFDVLIIGSGPAGAHAAVPLVEAGLQVAMLDGGFDAPAILSTGHVRNFEDIRRTDADQWRLFLGEDYSGIPVSGLEGGLGGGMTGGNRSYVTRETEKHLPLEVENGLVIQSLAKGGLGAAWGAACTYFSSDDLTAMGLPPDMDRHYETVSRRIGISGPANRPYVQPALPPDHHAAAILQRANKRKTRLNRAHMSIVQPHSAVLTRDMGERKASTLSDMEYYCDPDKSVYRPAMTIDELQKQDNFCYIGGVVVQHLEQTGDGVLITGYAINAPAEQRHWKATRVVLAAGAVNTARILLRSLGLYDTPIPFVGKPHMYSACLHPATLLTAGPRERSALCQLLITDHERTDNGLDAGCAQLYSYRSLLLFRLLGSVPLLPTPQALALLALYTPSLVIADIRFPATANRGHTLRLERSANNKDALRITCVPGRTPAQLRSLKRLRSAMRLAGLLPLRTVDMPEASTSHYAGTVPCGVEAPLSCDADGRVQQMRSVFVADASMFRNLPALPHTLTIMANAQRIGEGVVRSLKD